LHLEESVVSKLGRDKEHPVFQQVQPNCDGNRVEVPGSKPPPPKGQLARALRRAPWWFRRSRRKAKTEIELGKRSERTPSPAVDRWARPRRRKWESSENGVRRTDFRLICFTSSSSTSRVNLKRSPYSVWIMKNMSFLCLCITWATINVPPLLASTRCGMRIETGGASTRE
jgi:hypothetical protein